jgi:hypothetical protein
VATNACKGTKFSGTDKIPAGDRIYQPLGVCGSGLPENLFRIADFLDLPLVHDHYSITDIMHHTQIMGNENSGKSHFSFQVIQEVEHLSLYADIQR